MLVLTNSPYGFHTFPLNPLCIPFVSLCTSFTFPLGSSVKVKVSPAGLLMGRWGGGGPATRRYAELH